MGQATGLGAGVAERAVVASHPTHDDRMMTRTSVVDGRATSYATGGHGLPVVFLHGWGLDHRSYHRSLRRLTSRGCQVFAPSMPGFGGTAPLPSAERNLIGYAAWVDRFLDALDIAEPVLVLGHSFGGGVATQFAHDAPDRVRYLVLLNSVGDRAASFAHLRSRLTGGIATEMLGQVRQLHNSWRPVAEELATAGLNQRTATENILRHPIALAQAAAVGIAADLSSQMSALAARELPVLVLWSNDDGVLPLASFDTFCTALGTSGQVVKGGHSWLLANPDVFGEVLDNVIHVQRTEHVETARTATTAELRALLAGTTLPTGVAARLLDEVSPLWLLSEAPAVLAADLALCHPPLRRDEVRAAARPGGTDGSFRLTVVAEDRAGLLADTAATLAGESVAVHAASVTTWNSNGLALHALTVRSATRVPLDDARWAAIGERLGAMERGSVPAVPFVTGGRVQVTSTRDLDGRSVVRVTATDRIGLLSAVARWFAEQGTSIEAADITTDHGEAADVFVVSGEVDTIALMRHLRGDDRVRCGLLDGFRWMGRILASA